MERILTAPLITHRAMDNVIEATVIYYARYGERLFPTAEKLKAAARERWPNGSMIAPFINWLEAQEIQLTPEDFIKD